MDKVLTTIIAVLQKLEEAIPPASGRHHSFTLSDEDSRLSLNIWVPKTNALQIVYVDEGDFNDPESLVTGIVSLFRIHHGVEGLHA